MFRTIALTGATAAAIIGVGTAALATSGPDSTSGTAATTTQAGKATTAKHDAKHKLRAILRHAVHASVVTKGKDGYVVHSAVRGTVSAVSATSLTVKAADGYTETFTLTKQTKVRERSATAGKKGTAGTPADLKTGDKVGVVGKAPDKANSVPTATVVVDGLTK